MPWQWPWRRQDRALFQIGDMVIPSTAAGVAVTTESALRLSTVWACVRLLADSVSTLPLHVYRGEDREPIGTPPLLQRPSADFPELSDWLWAVMSSLLLRGNAWGVITARTGPAMTAAQVDLAHPDHVSVDTASVPGRTIIRIGGDEYDRSEIFHVKAYPMAGSMEGMSPVAYARESIALGIGAERYAAKFFGDAAVPAGVITTDQNVKDDTVDRIKARWKEAHQGRRDIAVLGNGARFQALSLAPNEAQFIETQKLNTSTIARIYGIAPELVGGETAGHQAYSSPEMRSTEFLTFTLRPWLHRVERAVSGLLPRSQRARFNAGGMVRATLLDRYRAHQVALQAGFLTVNEVRDLEDRPPLPESEGVVA
jgi:HK97 family phage portal protein